MKRTWLLAVVVFFACIVALLPADTIRDGVDRVMSGSWTFTGTVSLPANSIDQTMVKTNALFIADNQVHRFPVDVAAIGTVTSVTTLVHVAKYAGILQSVDAVCSTAPTGDYTITIDVHKSTSGGAFATVLTSTFALDVANTDRVAESGTLDGTKDDYVAGDVFEIIVTAAGSSGAQGSDMNITLFTEENPQ